MSSLAHGSAEAGAGGIVVTSAGVTVAGTTHPETEDTVAAEAGVETARGFVRVVRDAARVGDGGATVQDHGAALVLGVPVDDVDMDDAVDCVYALVDDSRRSGRCHQVATVNVDFVINALADPRLGSVMLTTALSIPDGMPIVWASWLLHSKLRTRVAGADLVPRVVERAAATGDRVLLYGGSDGVAEAAAEQLRRDHPGADVIGIEAPRFGDIDEVGAETLEDIRSVAPDICCVAFGNPKQELFIHRFGAELGVPVMIGVGGSLDFIVGKQRRAPVWMQRSGLEWLYRAATDPRRLGRRYLRDIAVYVPAIVRQAWSGRRSTRAGSVTVGRSPDDTVVVDASALDVLDNELSSDLVGVIRSARRSGTEIDASAPTWMRCGARSGDGLALMRAMAQVQRLCAQGRWHPTSGAPAPD